jgi:hypothetical protein
MLYLTPPCTFMLTYPSCTKIRSVNYYGKPFGFHAKNYQTIKWQKSYFSCYVDLLETWRHFDRERISVLVNTLPETAVMRDFKCPSLKGDRLVIFVCFTRYKKRFAHISAADRRSHSERKQSEHRKLFFLANRNKSTAVFSENIWLRLLV